MARGAVLFTAQKRFGPTPHAQRRVGSREPARRDLQDARGRARHKSARLVSRQGCPVDRAHQEEQRRNRTYARGMAVMATSMTGRGAAIPCWIIA